MAHHVCMSDISTDDAAYPAPPAPTGPSLPSLNSEPVGILEALRLAAAAGITFGLPLNEGQEFAIFVLVSAVLSWVARQRVFSPATVVKHYIPKVAVHAAVAAADAQPVPPAPTTPAAVASSVLETTPEATPTAD